MKLLDRLLQSWRIRMARPFLPRGVRLIDVGAHRGELFDALGDRLGEGFGIEPLLTARESSGSHVLEPGFFPRIRPPGTGWDAVTMLAVLEHIPLERQAEVADACFELLRVGGRVIVTVPARAVDRILTVLEMAGAIDGMSLEEHFGFDPGDTVRVFGAPRFELVRHRRFQLGLNHLFVFEKRADPG